MAFFNNRVVYLSSQGYSSFPLPTTSAQLRSHSTCFFVTGQVVFFKLKRSGQHPTLKLLQRYKQPISDKVSAAFSVGGGLVVLRLGPEQFGWNAKTLENLPRLACLQQCAINVQAASKAEVENTRASLRSPLAKYLGVAVVLTATPLYCRVDYQPLGSLSATLG